MTWMVGSLLAAAWQKRRTVDIDSRSANRIAHREPQEGVR